jgi:hypothetical protein
LLSSKCNLHRYSAVADAHSLDLALALNATSFGTLPCSYYNETAYIAGALAVGGLCSILYSGDLGSTPLSVNYFPSCIQ